MELKDVINFGDLCWGSCQYDAAAEMYRQLCITAKECGRSRILTIFEANTFRQQSEEAVYAAICHIYRGSTEDEEELAHVNKVIAVYPEPTVSNCFKICRSLAWDLWSTAPEIACIVFPDLDLTKVPDTHKDKLFGPLLNQIVQSGNDRTGFCCWLLESFGYATEADFMDFDT